jgi:hypothetical protein
MITKRCADSMCIIKDRAFDTSLNQLNRVRRIHTKLNHKICTLSLKSLCNSISSTSSSSSHIAIRSFNHNSKTTTQHDVSHRSAHKSTAHCSNRSFSSAAMQRQEQSQKQTHQYIDINTSIDNDDQREQNQWQSTMLDVENNNKQQQQQQQSLQYSDAIFDLRIDEFTLAAEVELEEEKSNTNNSGPNAHESPAFDDSDSDDDADASTLDEEEMEALRKQNAALTPSVLVGLLDQHIIGQMDAKKKVAVALRNRYRRHQLSEIERAETMPKNLLVGLLLRN